jgi:hypothetical protein
MEPEARTERPGASKRRIALIRTLPIVIFTVLFGAVIVFLSLRTAGGLRQSEQLAAGFTPLAAACEGTGIEETSPYTVEAGIHPVVTFRQVEGEWVLTASLLPASWLPATPAEAELVLCLQEQMPLTTPRCTPTAEGSLPTRVYGYQLALRLYETRSGDLLVEDVLNSAPRTLTCWEADAEPQALSVSTEQLRNRLSPFVDLP